MKNMLITGGKGDIAQAIASAYQKTHTILSPSSKELDVSDKHAVVRYLKDKSIDVLINNAGTIHPKTVLESDMMLWERDIKVNLIGAYFVTKCVLENNPQAIIINISSTAAFNAYPDWSSYCASKAALVTLTKCLANDQFQAYALCPGAVHTRFRDNLGLDNSNEMTTDAFVAQINKVLSKDYNSGDVVFFRKNECIINP